MKEEFIDMSDIAEEVKREEAYWGPLTDAAFEQLAHSIQAEENASQILEDSE